VLSNYFFFFENRAVCEIMWKNMVEPDRPQMTIWRMRIACWIPNATVTLTICNTCYFSTATVFARTRLNIALYTYVHCSLFSSNGEWEYLSCRSGWALPCSCIVVSQNRTDDAPYASAQILNYGQQGVPAGFTQLPTDELKCRADAP
jgi:hypothetical protein